MAQQGFNWRAEAIEAARAEGVRPSLMLALIRQESGGQQGVSSGAGAIGFTQLMPATAASLGVDPHDPRQNIRGGAKYLAQQLKAFKGDEMKALAAYNAGPGAVSKYGGVPPYKETQNYVKRVLAMSREGSGAADRGATAARASAPAVPAAAKPDNYSARMNLIFDDDPAFAAMLGQRHERNKPAAAPAATSAPTSAGGALPPAKGGFRTPNGVIRNRLPGEDPYKFLLRLARKGFGLDIDGSGDETGQTTGGKHTTNSLHYGKRAVDLGVNRNGKDALDQFYQWANQRRDTLGVEELIWQAPDHYDHLHIGVRG